MDMEEGMGSHIVDPADVDLVRLLLMCGKKNPFLTTRQQNDILKNKYRQLSHHHKIQVQRVYASLGKVLQEMDGGQVRPVDAVDQTR